MLFPYSWQHKEKIYNLYKIKKKPQNHHQKPQLLYCLSIISNIAGSYNQDKTKIMPQLNKWIKGT